LFALAVTVGVLPQLAISKHFTVNLHKSLIGALSLNFTRYRQLRQHAVGSSNSYLVIFSEFVCCNSFSCIMTSEYSINWLFLINEDKEFGSAEDWQAID
jgi:hypothetical protein